MQSQCKRYEMYIPKYPIVPYMKLRATIGQRFAAFTEHPLCLGYWKRPDTPVVYEEHVAVIILVLTPDREDELLDVLREYKAAANQQAVMLASSPIDVVML